MGDSKDLPGHRHCLHLGRGSRQEAGRHIIAEVGVAKRGAGPAGRTIGYKPPRASSLFIVRTAVGQFSGGVGAGPVRRCHRRAPQDHQDLSDSANDFFRPPKHLIPLLFWRGDPPEQIRIVFSLLLYRHILYNIDTRHVRASQPRRTLSCRAQSPFAHCPTHLRHAVSAWLDFRALQQVWQTQLPLRRRRRALVAVSCGPSYWQGTPDVRSEGDAGPGSPSS